MYAVMRLNKLKSMGQVSARGAHNERTRDTPNADSERLHTNERLAGSVDWLADVQARLADAPTIRSNAVLAYDLVFTASREFFDRGDAQEQADRLAAWRDRTMAWLRERFGADNVVAAILHRDELTPHIQAMVVPIDEKGHLNAREYTGGAAKLHALQDGYHAAVEDMGLVRGVRGSVAAHQDVKDYYTKIQEPTPAPEAVTQHIEVERPGRIVANPDRYVAAQQERLVERIAPIVDAALTKATHYEQQAAKAEANIVVLQGQVRDLQRERDTLRDDYKALAAQVRAVPLETVIERLGGQVDRYDAHKYRLDGEHISITGERFYNHDQQTGGGGAIDLVMHAANYDYREAVAYLRDTHGAEVAVTAAAWHGARDAHQQAQEIVERAVRPPFRAPTPDVSSATINCTDRAALFCTLADQDTPIARA